MALHARSPSPISALITSLPRPITTSSVLSALSEPLFASNASEPAPPAPAARARARAKPRVVKSASAEPDTSEQTAINANDLHPPSPTSKRSALSKASAVPAPTTKTRAPAKLQARARAKSPTPVMPPDRSQSLPAVSSASTSTIDAASENAVQPASKSKAPVKRAARGPDPVDKLIPTLPVYSHKDYEPVPAVVYTKDEEEANELIGALSGPLGFDLEWKVVFRRGAQPDSRRTAVVQLSDQRMIIVIQVSGMKRFPEKLKDLVENPDVIKCGANILNDAQKLFRDFGILARNLVELGGLARAADGFNFPYNRSIVSLARVVALYTQKQLLKTDVRTSDWERELTEMQIQYAANDAHCAVIVYSNLVKLAKDAAIELKPALYTSNMAARHEARRAVPAAPIAPAAPAAPAADPTPSTSTASQDTVIASPSASTPSTPVAPKPSPLPGTTVWPPQRSKPIARTASAPAAYTTAAVAVLPLRRPRHTEAYNLWQTDRLPLADICARMRPGEPLKESTVISYVVGALQSNPRLPYEKERLWALVQSEKGSWARHKGWLLGVDQATT